MNIRGLFLSMLCCVGAAASVCSSAKASEVLYDSAGFIQGQQSFEQSFELTGPGTLTVTLSNINWPTSLASLNMLVASSDGMLGPQMGEGTDDFKFEGGIIFAQWFGTAQGPLDTGLYGVKISWTPTAVPLPMSIALLASGVALLLWQRRGRRPGVHGGLAAS
jgi:hypothetical protein